MSVTSETDEEVMAGNGKDDANSGENAWGNGRLKKGPWTSAEDEILIEYVLKHGEGNWNAVQKHTGLARCGKSCRLRWANHLRPDLKKGQFSKEEENLIIELHAKMGNKWARMAAELPGRTDNEIKNYWNTRIKRRQRAGLPIYPPDMCLESLNENQQKDDMTDYPSGDLHYQDFIPIRESPIVNFRNSPPVPQSFLDLPLISLHSFQSKSLLSTDHSSKRLRVCESSYPGGLHATLSNAVPGGNQYQNESFVQNDHQSLIYSCASPSGAAILNGNPSSSSPDWVSKLELPSLQTPVDNWTSPSSLLPSLESVDALIQTPPTERALSCHLSPIYSGLLDTVPHESQIMQISRNTSHQESSHVMNTSSQGIPGNIWEQYGEISTILDHSSFCDSTPMSGHSFDEPISLDAIAGFIEEDEEAEAWCRLQFEDEFKKGPMQYEDKFNEGHTNNN